MVVKKKHNEISPDFGLVSEDYNSRGGESYCVLYVPFARDGVRVDPVEVKPLDPLQEAQLGHLG